MEPPFFAIQLFDDPTPNGLINQRYVQTMLALVHETEIGDEDGMEALNLVLLIAKKLAAVWKHKAEYSALEDALIAKARANPLRKGRQAGQIEVSQDLFIEFDELLVQVKSCLDHVVKLPALFVGKNVWTLRTFSDKGQGVLTAIDRNISPKYGGRRDCLAHCVDRNMFWMEAPIAARDRINHFIDGGIDFQYFRVYAQDDGGTLTLRVPMWSPEQTIRQFLEVIWKNLFSFTEDFTAACALLRLPQEHALVRIPNDFDSPESPWHITTQAEVDRQTRELGAKRAEFTNRRTQRPEEEKGP